MILNHLLFRLYLRHPLLFLRLLLALSQKLFNFYFKHWTRGEVYIDNDFESVIPSLKSENKTLHFI